jgi:hypothetical protein
MIRETWKMKVDSTAVDIMVSWRKDIVSRIKLEE